jgi:hypothetical protein
LSRSAGLRQPPFARATSGPQGRKFWSNAKARTRRPAAFKEPWRCQPFSKERRIPRNTRSSLLLVRCPQGWQ